MTPKPCILVVDDDPENLLLMSEILEPEGYQIQTAESGRQAVEMIHHVQPQLILLDVMMPDIDGFEVCQRIRRDTQAATVPIVFLTALDDDDSHLKSVQVMGDDYLTKPIKVDLLLQKIGNILKLSQLRSQSYQQQLADQARTTEAIQENCQRQAAAAWKISEALVKRFHLFVPQQFLNRVAPKGIESIQVGNAVESEMTVLFCDIREFTSIAEHQPARETFKWLNVFFERINQVVMENHGFIDKYMGDAVMAVFDQPQQHARDALNATLQICEAMAQFNQDRQKFGLESLVRIGVGLHSGTALVGVIGANQRMDTTVVGDVVNTASRLESLTKFYQCPLIVSRTVLDKSPNLKDFQFRWLDCVTPHGKTTELDIYELLFEQK